MDIKTKLIIGICCVVSFFLLVGILIGGDDSSTNKLGEKSIYDNIDITTDCDALQNVYNIAMDNVERRQPGDELRKVSLSYATYANTRMNNLDC